MKTLVKLLCALTYLITFGHLLLVFIFSYDKMTLYGEYGIVTIAAFDSVTMTLLSIGILLVALVIKYPGWVRNI